MISTCHFLFLVSIGVCVTMIKMRDASGCKSSLHNFAAFYQSTQYHMIVFFHCQNKMVKHNLTVSHIPEILTSWTIGSSSSSMVLFLIDLYIHVYIQKNIERFRHWTESLQWNWIINSLKKLLNKCLDMFCS